MNALFINSLIKVFLLKGFIFSKQLLLYKYYYKAIFI